MWEHFQEGVTPHADVPAPKPCHDLNQRWFDPEWRAGYLDWYVAHSCLKADILPVANTQLGPGSLAAILGGVFEGGEDTIWIHPNPDDTDDITFDPNHPNWLLHKDLLRACKRKAQGHYYVGMPDLMEGLDVLAALKGTDQVLLDTVMRPELLERQIQQVNDIYFRVFDELYDIIREGDEMAFCYFSSWAPGKMTKLQSDISTMISVDDFRRFVQPFIREQCQKIPYTLYHLDGVGAIRHLDALLEIDELNAIQWTPGVGKPQGGSPKWYDLYKKILAAGKSVMACWVTLDELRPLLDNIGGDGVHIEMDFHNEREVEEAMRIVEEYQNSKKADKMLILDGAMGTMIQQYQLREEDFRGSCFINHPIDLKGCNDVLALTAPSVICDIHRKYLKAGADIIETNTFNAQRISLQDYGLQDHVRDINLAAARLARQCADEFRSSDIPRYVIGSIGPTSRTIFDGGEPFADALREAYSEQIRALVDGGVDALLIETIFDVENARVAIEVARTVAPKLPVMLSFNVTTPDGHNMLGQDIVEFLKSLPPSFYSIGINCVTDIAQMTPLILQLAQFGTRVSFYPNAGLPDAQGRYQKTPESFVADLWPLLEGHHLNIIGGCCGTTDAHIACLARVIEPLPGLRLSPLTFEQRTNTDEHGLSLEQRTNTDEYGQSLKQRTNTDEHGLFTGNKQSVQVRVSPMPKEETQSVPVRVSPMPKEETQSVPVRVSPMPKEETQSDAKDDALFDAILAGNAADAVAATHAAIASGAAPQDIINGQMIRAMSEVGHRFQNGKAFVPQLLMAGRAMKAALELLKPLMAGEASAAIGKVVIGTVKGDLHDIGKNLVASMLEGCGFEVVNIGIDVSADKFIEAVKENQPDILCMSALLTTTMGYMREVIAALEHAGIRQQVKVMVGGAPVTQGFADEIGADGYSDNANSAVTVAKQLLAGK